MNEKIKDLISRVYKIKNITQYFWNILLFLLLETLYIIRPLYKGSHWQLPHLKPWGPLRFLYENRMKKYVTKTGNKKKNLQKIKIIYKCVFEYKKRYKNVDINTKSFYKHLPLCVVQLFLASFLCYKITMLHCWNTKLYSVLVSKLISEVFVLLSNWKNFRGGEKKDR